jgi:hypothetical protein
VQIIAPATLLYAAIYADGWIGKEVTETIGGLNAVQLQRKVRPHRERDTHADVVNAGVETMAHSLSYSVAIVFDHHPKVSALAVPEVTIRLDGERYTAEIRCQSLPRGRSGAEIGEEFLPTGLGLHVARKDIFRPVGPILSLRHSYGTRH